MGKNNSLISLFAGAGGLDIGLERAGFEALAVNEIEDHACQTLRENKQLGLLSDSEFKAWFAKQLEQRAVQHASPKYVARLRARLRPGVGRNSVLARANVLQKDVRELKGKELQKMARIRSGELTLLAGGPPCQPFSRAGKRETVEVSDGRLFLEFVRLVRELRPRWFLFENVKGLAQSRTTVIRTVCSTCGTKAIVPFRRRMELVSVETSSSKCPGCGRAGRCSVDADDERGGSLEIIVNEFESIGYTCRHRLLNAADFGVPQLRERLFIIGSRDGEDFAWPCPTHASPEPDRILQLSLGLEQTRQWRTMKDVLWRSGHPDFGRLSDETAVLWVKNVVRPHDEPVTWSLDRPSPTIGAHQAAKLALAPFGVPEAQLRRQQWHTLGKRQGDLPPVDVVHAYLSDQELLELQTFPTTWYLHGTRMERAFQIGNAVPPMLAAAVGEAILKACGISTTQESLYA